MSTNHSKVILPSCNRILQYLPSVSIIDPRGSFKRKWNILTILFIFYSAIYVPFIIGFRVHENPAMSIFGLFIDSYYFFDIILEFKTAYKRDIDQVIVTDPTEIALRYLSTWFIFDLLSILPLDYIFNTILKSLILRRIFLGFKICRLRKFHLFPELLRDLSVGRKYFDLQMIMSKVAFLLHVFACIWYFIATDDNTNGEVVTQSITSNVTTYSPNTWVYQSGFGGTSIAERYVASVYWTVTTMMTVGYGDVHAVNSLEHLVSVLIELVSVIVFSAIVAEIVSFINNLNPKKTEIKFSVDELMTYLTERPIPIALRKRTKVWEPLSYQNSCFTFLSPYNLAIHSYVAPL